MSEELKSCPFCGSSGNCDTAFPHPSEKGSMTTFTNWPNPERLGVPMFPERDGWHIMRCNLSPGGDYFRYWHSKEELWSEGRCRNLDRFIPLPKYGHDPDYVACHYEYIGPVLTPTQIAELLAGERERCAKACDVIATFASSDWKATAYDSDNRASDAAEETAEICAQNIRNLGDVA